MPESKKIRCLIIDDELPAKEILRKHITGVEALEMSGICFNAVEAISFLKDNSAPPFLYFHADRKMVKVLFTDILYIEGLNDYIKIVTTQKTIITKHLLASLKEMLPPGEFARIHKSFIIGFNKIESFNADSVEIAKKEIPIGRSYKFGLNKILSLSAALQAMNSSAMHLPKKNNGDGFD